MQDKSSVPPPRPKDPVRPWLIVWACGAGLAFLFLGLIFVVYWTLAVLCAVVFVWRPVVGVLAFALLAAFGLGPGLFDRYFLDRQIAAVSQAEVRGAPLDLRGKRILVLGTSRPYDESPVACGYVCDALVRHGGAEEVLFGMGTRTSYFRPNGPVDLTTLELYRYVPPYTGRTPISSPYERAELGDIDYALVDGNTPPEDVEAELKRLLPDFLGIFGGEVQLDYLVIPVPDETELDIYGSTPLFSALRLVRYNVTMPFVPGLHGGSLYSRHWTLDDKEHGWVKSNGFEALTFLCGPSDRPGHSDCVQALDANPHY